jgi:hypothetical protein
MAFREVIIEKGGSITGRDKFYFGGEFSFLEKIKMGGTGSTKVIYESGITAFDQLGQVAENELSFVNFELLKNGLLMRLNRNQQIRCVGIRLDDIQTIELLAFRIEVIKNKWGKTVKEIVYRGELAIHSTDGEQINLQVITQQFKSLLRFLKRKPFEGKFRHSISPLPPEKSLADPLEGPRFNQFHFLAIIILLGYVFVKNMQIPHIEILFYLGLLIFFMAEYLKRNEKKKTP